MPKRKVDSLITYKFNLIYLRYFKSNVCLLLFTILALYDLRNEIQLVLQRFTYTSLFYMVMEHPLSIGILLLFTFRTLGISREKI